MVFVARKHCAGVCERLRLVGDSCCARRFREAVTCVNTVDGSKFPLLLARIVGKVGTKVRGWDVGAGPGTAGALCKGGAHMLIHILRCNSPAAFSRRQRAHSWRAYFPSPPHS